MHVRTIAIILALAATTVLACGSEESRLDRGIAVDQEVAVPESDRELAETEQERERQNVREEQHEAQELFDESQ
jgi:hypothetical protein